MGVFREYYLLAKPGIIRGNAITALAGYLLASKGNPDLSSLPYILIGFALTIASSCVLNNVIDRDIDAKMSRTKKRALVTGAISVQNALVFTVILMVTGVILLYYYANLITIMAGFIGWFFYIVMYSLYTKRQTVWGTVVGSVSGAIPPVAGYLAFTNNVDSGVLLLFATLVFWQMPHFYAIAIMQQKDYAEAGINVMPVVYGLKSTKIQSIIYILGFGAVSAGLYAMDYTGKVFLTVMLVLTAWWLYVASKEVNLKNQVKWGLGLFKLSLVVLLTWSALLMFENKLP